MNQNPYINAIAASLYIAVVASAMYYVPKIIGRIESVMVPIVILSLFTLSAAVMGYFFLFHPAQLYLDGKKKEAVHFFLTTLFSFAAITALLFIMLTMKVL